MGGVQAKPERRPVLERKTSFAKNHRIVPINSEPRIFEELMRSYQADCKDDKELQDFDAELSSGAEEVVRSTGLDRFKQCLKYLTHSNEKIVRVILSCKKQIVEAEGVGARMVMTANEQLLDQFLIKETLSTRLVRSIHVSCITDVVLDWEVSKKLNESQKMYHRSAEAVVAKVKSLRDQHRDMLDKLKDRIVKFDRKLELTRTLKKVVNVVFMGMLFGLFVCTIMAAAMAAPPVASALTSHPCITGVVAGGAVGYAFSAVLKEGQHWLLTFIQGYKSTLEAHTGVIKSMEAGTRDAIKELDDIMCHVNKVIAKGNDPVLSNLSSANDEGRVDVVDQEVTSILEKLAEFGKEIEELDEKREQCLRVIETARDKVLGEYGELKSSPVWNTKIKK
ncbi:UPF0496 protein At4g34330 [Rosa chinensis]|uniref:UPF0496 protein At4g34330 n=1 Tax=Rosa chinensis TaxID=74649 RepID=UPI000D0931F0|nr:UPF0496 protein At4g34330 [Rosa chinensis]